MFVSVKDRTYLTSIASAFWINFCCVILFSYWKVNIRMWHYLSKYEKVSMSSLKCEYISSYGQRRNISFWITAHWYGLNFLYLFIGPENLILTISKKLAPLTFLSEKVSTFVKCKSYMYTLQFLITLCNMPKVLVT